jgi:lysophospholipase
MERQTIDRRALPANAVISAWKAPDGWTHRRMDWLQPKGAAPRGSLLFASGRGDFIEKYLEAHHHWHCQGWNVTAFDWRSQGGSRGDIIGGHLESLDPLVGDLEALIADWQAERPGPYAIVGHSMGGHLVLRTLIERSPTVDAVVLVAPMLGINSGPVPAWAAAWTAGLAGMSGWSRTPVWRPSGPTPAGSMRQAILTSCLERYEDELWWWEKEPGFNLGSPSWGWLNAAYRSCETLTPRALASVQTPLLLVGTERDRLVSPEAIAQTAAAIPGAELLMFPNAGHEILREADLVRLAALACIDDFLGRHARE